MDNPDQRTNFSISEQARRNPRCHDREHSFQQGERRYDVNSNDRERRNGRRKPKKERKKHFRPNPMSVQRYTPALQNFHHQIPPNYFQRPPSEKHKPNTIRFDYYTRRHNYTQISRESRRDWRGRGSWRDEMDWRDQSRNRNRYRGGRRSLSPQSRSNHHKTKFRRYNDLNGSPLPVYHSKSSEYSESRSANHYDNHKRRYNDLNDSSLPVHHPKSFGYSESSESIKSVNHYDNPKTKFRRYNDLNNSSLPVHHPKLSEYSESLESIKSVNHYDNPKTKFRRYNYLNDSPLPVHHPKSPESSESSESVKSVKESIKHQQVNTEFASRSYLDMANGNSVYEENPSPKLLVLDLNGTLVHRANAKRDIIPRPHIDKFLKYIFESNSFKVMVWSSAQPKNVDKMVRTAFGHYYQQKLVAKWTRNHMELSDIDYHQNVETTKDLEKVWKELNDRNSTTLPKIVWDQTNTILIDDSCLKAKLQPYNAIHLPDFDDERWRSNNDHELNNVIGYLKKLHKQSNVSAYIRKNPYTSNDNKKSSTFSASNSRDHSMNNNDDLENEKNSNCVTS